jgi:hypothetical protein
MGNSVVRRCIRSIATVEVERKVIRGKIPKGRPKQPTLFCRPPLPNLVVVSLSAAYSAMWPTVANQCGLTYTPIASVADFDGLLGEIVIVSGPGNEDALEPAIRTIAHGHLTAIELAAAGARADHRLAAALVRAGASTYFALPDDMQLLTSWLRERGESLAVDRQRPGRAIARIPFPATIATITRAAAHAMLDYCDGNKSEAARRLGISRPRLQRLLDAAETCAR